MSKRYKGKSFKGELHRCKFYVQQVYDVQTLNRLKREWMDNLNEYPKNWTQRAIKSLAEDDLHKDIRLI